MTGEELTIAVATTFVLAIFGVVFVAALFGRDLECFESYKNTAPEFYRNLKQVCRFNGLIVAIMSGCGVIATPLVVFDPKGGVLVALGMLAGCAMALWLSVRWYFWSLKP